MPPNAGIKTIAFIPMINKSIYFLPQIKGIFYGNKTIDSHKGVNFNSFGEPPYTRPLRTVV